MNMSWFRQVLCIIINYVLFYLSCHLGLGSTKAHVMRCGRCTQTEEKKYSFTVMHTAHAYIAPGHPRPGSVPSACGHGTWVVNIAAQHPCTQTKLTTFLINSETTTHALACMLAIRCLTSAWPRHPDRHIPLPRHPTTNLERCLQALAPPETHQPHSRAPSWSDRGPADSCIAHVHHSHIIFSTEHPQIIIGGAVLVFRGMPRLSRRFHTDLRLPCNAALAD